MAFDLLTIDYISVNAEQLEDRTLGCTSPGGLTMVDDAVLQQSLAQIDAFLRLADLSVLHQPGHQFAAGTQNVDMLKAGNVFNYLIRLVLHHV